MFVTLQWRCGSFPMHEMTTCHMLREINKAPPGFVLNTCHEHIEQFDVHENYPLGPSPRVGEKRRPDQRYRRKQVFPLIHWQVSSASLRGSWCEIVGVPPVPKKHDFFDDPMDETVFKKT